MLKAKDNQAQSRMETALDNMKTELIRWIIGIAAVETALIAALLIYRTIYLGA